MWCCDVFPCLKAFQVVLGSWNPKSTICLFRARKLPCQAPKTLRFKGKMANFEATNAVKQGKKRQKDKWYPIRACTGERANLPMVPVSRASHVLPLLKLQLMAAPARGPCDGNDKPAACLLRDRTLWKVMPPHVVEAAACRDRCSCGFCA